MARIVPASPRRYAASLTLSSLTSMLLQKHSMDITCGRPFTVCCLSDAPSCELLHAFLSYIGKFSDYLLWMFFFGDQFVEILVKPLIININAKPDYIRCLPHSTQPIGIQGSVMAMLVRVTTGRAQQFGGFSPIGGTWSLSNSATPLKPPDEGGFFKSSIR